MGGVFVKLNLSVRWLKEIENDLDSVTAKTITNCLHN
jgi:hypothetical protein